MALLVYLVRSRGWFRDENERMRREMGEHQQTPSPYGARLANRALGRRRWRVLDGVAVAVVGRSWR